MIAHSLSAVLALSLMTIASELSRTPAERLRYTLQHIGGSPGELGYQAKLDGFDYRRHLRQAIDGKQAAFAALFDYTANGRLMGVGAEEHGAVLYNLLRLWGDDFFSDVLRTRRPNVRRSVISWIDWQFPYPGWKLNQYPKTYELGTYREKPKK